jgi:hypothetical protein
LEEKTLNPNTGRPTNTHAKLVSDYNSLNNNMPYLFIYKKYKHLKISNTTNPLDGGVFSQLKKHIKLHQGLAKRNKLKFIDEYMSSYNSKVRPDKKRK